MSEYSTNSIIRNLLKVISKTTELFRTHFSIFITIGVIFGCVNVLMQSLFVVLSIKSMAVFVLVSLLLTSVASIACIEASSRALIGKPIDLKEIFRGIGKKYIAFITVSTLVILLSSIGARLFVLPGLLCLTFFIFADVLIVCENLDLKSAMLKSVEIVKPSFWLVLVFNIILFTSLIILLLLLQEVQGSMPLVYKILNVAFIVFFPPFFNLLKVVLYYGCKSDDAPSVEEPEEENII